VEVTLVRRALDGVVKVELIGRSLACELAQTPERDLDVAGAELDLVVEVLVLALVPYLDGAPLAVLLLADAHAGGGVGVPSLGRCAAGSDPLVAPLVAPLLLLEALLQLLHDLVPAAQRLDLGLFLLAQIELGQRAQPLLRDLCLDRLAHELKTLEDVTEHLIELVEM